MNYLGFSIIEEVQGVDRPVTDLIPNVDNTYDLGSESKRWEKLYLTNNLPLDDRSLPTQLFNGLFVSMCHPMRFSNGVPSGPLTFNGNAVTTYTLSGYGTASAFTDAMTSLKYAGTYKYHVSAAFNVLGLAAPATFFTSLNYNVKIGDRVVCTAPGIVNVLSTLDNAPNGDGVIDISGTINMLEDAGIENTSFYTTMTVSYKNSNNYSYCRTWTNYLTDVDTTTNSHYSLDILGIVQPPALYDVAVTRHIGTLECIYSNVAPATT